MIIVDFKIYYECFKNACKPSPDWSICLSYFFCFGGFAAEAKKIASAESGK